MASKSASSVCPSVTLELLELHPAQEQVLADAGRFNVVVAGRRWGKSRFGEDLTADPLLDGLPVCWCSPTYKMLSEIWRETCETLRPVTASVNVAEHRLELVTGGVLDMWSLDAPDSIRGRRYKRLIVDEAAMVRALLDIWNLVLRPTLIDFGGDAWFLSTPKGKNDFMALYELGQDGAAPDWKSWRFPTATNPHLAPAEIEGMRSTMPARAYEQEIEARFIDEVTGALWTYSLIDGQRLQAAPELRRIVVAIDPAVSANPDSDETGIVAAGIDGQERPNGYVLADASGTYSPETWARKAIALYQQLQADMIVAEANQGGDMVRSVLRTVDPSIRVHLVHASRGKVTRAEPVVAMYEQGRVHHVGHLPELETQMTMWSPVDDKDSPDRVDALVWALSELLLKRVFERPKARVG